MFNCGALVLNSTSNKLIPSLYAAAKLVKEVLYVPLVSSNDGPGCPGTDMSQRITQLYLHASKVNPHLDLRVILPNAQQKDSMMQTQLHNQVEAILSPSQLQDITPLREYSCIQERSGVDDVGSLFEPLTLKDPVGPFPTANQSKDNTPTYTDVALGGTFDCLHNGHRLLLTHAAMIATHRVLVGIASGPLLANKTLMELIKPVNVRINQVKDILEDCRPDLVYDVLPITDVYGPTAWDGELTCLVTSPETADAVNVINEERKKKDLSPLSLYTIPFVEEGKDTPATLANKTSSSELRKKQLAIYRTPKINRCISVDDWKKSSSPYLIGLTGNTACGKSTIAKRLQDKGAYPIPCDKLGHSAYLLGTKAHSEIVAEFGKDILNEQGEVDRRKLGAIVFADKSKLNKLNEIVWPAIWALAEQEIDKAKDNGFKVCVVDAAVMLQAEWDRRVHEVWVPVIAPKESVKRVMERDGLTEERAKQRLASQITGAEAAEHAHVILCTQWEYEYTQTQVDKAWTDLQSRIKSV